MNTDFLNDFGNKTKQQFIHTNPIKLNVGRIPEYNLKFESTPVNSKINKFAERFSKLFNNKKLYKSEKIQ